MPHPFDPTAYGPAVAELLRQPRLAPLGPGSPNRSAQPLLDALTDESLLAPHPVRDHDLAAACRAALWLYHDFLDQSHALSQEIATPTGSYWHGLMHRREPDFSNSKNWFRRVGEHLIFDALRQAAAELAAAPPHPAAAFLQKQARWNPFAFIDLCEASLRGKAPYEMLCRQIQQREWELLFDHCWHGALGR